MIFTILTFINLIFEGLYKEAEKLIDIIHGRLSDLLGAMLYLFLIPLGILNRITEYLLNLCKAHRAFVKNREIFIRWYKEHKEELEK